MGNMQKDKGAVQDLSVFILGEFTDRYESVLNNMRVLSCQASKYGLNLEHIRRVHDNKKKKIISIIIDEKAFYEDQINILNGK